MRVGAIDVGTNSVHLLVADVLADGTWTVVEKARAQVELGKGGLDDNRLSDGAFQRGLDAMDEFAEAARSLNVEAVHCAATSAVREAKNGADWCRSVRKTTGIHVQVIPGQEEGRLIYLGARTDLDFSFGKILLMDLGGGSTEFILCDSEEPKVIRSLPLGHIRLSEGLRHPPEASQRKALRDRIKTSLKPLTSQVKGKRFRTLVGTSGTLRCLARMATLARGDLMPAHSHGLVLGRDELAALIERLCDTDWADLSEIPGLDPKRRRTITAGAILVHQVMATFGKDELVTSERSLRDGLVADWIIKNRPEIALSTSVRDPRERSIRSLMQRYGADFAHAEQVRDHAMTLFDATAPLHRLGFAERDLLEKAALVHDIGHHVAGESHNRHSQYLIRNSRLHGFTTPEIEKVALLARYHRGGKPKVDHPEFEALDDGERRVIRILAGILRVADALDRSHSQSVPTLSVDAHDGVIDLQAQTTAASQIEQWAVERRKVLLESALGQEIRLQVLLTDTTNDPHALPVR